MTTSTSRLLFATLAAAGVARAGDYPREPTELDSNASRYETPYVDVSRDDGVTLGPTEMRPEPPIDDWGLEVFQPERLYVTHSSGRVSVVDPVHGTITPFLVPETGQLTALAISSEEQRVFVGSDSTATLYALDLQTGAIVDKAELPDSGNGDHAWPVSVVVAPGGGRVYVGDGLGVVIEGRDTQDLSQV